MALDPLTWLLITAAIITAYCIALKLSEKSGEEIQTPETAREPEIYEIPSASMNMVEEKPETAKISEETWRPQKNETTSPQKPPEDEKPREPPERTEAAEPKPEKISESDLKRLEKEINELKTLIELSAELKKELEKLSKIIKPPKTGKTVN